VFLCGGATLFYAFMILLEADRQTDRQNPDHGLRNVIPKSPYYVTQMKQINEDSIQLRK
jgi:hypothetical protein